MKRGFSFTLISLALCVGSLGADPTLTNQHAALLGESVLKLLESRNVEGFANELAVSNQFNRRTALESARLVLEQASRMRIEPARVRFIIKEVRAKATGSGENPQKKGDMLPTSFGIRILLNGAPAQNSQSDRLLAGEYELALGGAFEFPDGWRTFEGIRWSRLPEGLADERTKSDMAVVSNIVEHVGMPLHAADDPALAALGNTLVRFIKQRDEKVYTEALHSFEEQSEALLAKLKASGMTNLPAKADLQESWNI